jgi:hypothetical protein
VRRKTNSPSPAQRRVNAGAQKFPISYQFEKSFLSVEGLPYRYLKLLISPENQEEK